MLRGILKRSFASILSVWFLLVVLEPGAIHSCPVHDGGASGHSSHAAQMAHSGHDGSRHAPHQQCSCPGDCASSAAQALPSHGFSIASSTVMFDESRAIAPEQNAVTRAGFLLPFAIGPPAALTA